MPSQFHTILFAEAEQMISVRLFLSVFRLFAITPSLSLSLTLPPPIVFLSFPSFIQKQTFQLCDNGAISCVYVRVKEKERACDFSPPDFFLHW